MIQLNNNNNNLLSLPHYQDYKNKQTNLKQLTHLDNLYHQNKQTFPTSKSQLLLKKHQHRQVNSQKTTSEILKENILQNRHNQRILKLQQITADNIKLFCRIRDQSSQYKLNKEPSSSGLKSKAKFSRLKSFKSCIRYNDADKENFRLNSGGKGMGRCVSANFMLKEKCQLLKAKLKNTNLQPDNKIVNGQSKLTMGALFSQEPSEKCTGRTKISLKSLKSDAYSEMVQQKLIIQYPYSLEQKVINKKLAGLNITKQNKIIFPSSNNTTRSSKYSSFLIKKQKQTKGILTQRNIQFNIIQKLS